MLGSGNGNTFLVDVLLDSGSGGDVHLRRIVSEVVDGLPGNSKKCFSKGMFAYERLLVQSKRCWYKSFPCLTTIAASGSMMFTLKLFILPGSGDLIISRVYDATGSAMYVCFGVIESESAWFAR